MKSIAGVFTSRDDAAKAITRLKAVGIHDDQISFLTPEHPDAQISAVPTTEGEAPGMGSALGAVVGGASGAALGAAAASLLIPGVGPIAAIGFAAISLFGGAGGAVAGAAAGENLESKLDHGLPTDELFVYEDALRHGKSVVLVMSDDDLAEAARTELSAAGAESIDAARSSWWGSLRESEAASYRAAGGDFDRDEPVYRRGFERALDGELRGRSYEESIPRLRSTDADCYEQACFRHGYERGASYTRTPSTGDSSPSDGSH
ncbi:MAG: hypothetical protein JWQ98_1638 [Chlorobi bacterium]|nr:hypothetical protein [Chlorobiota bacterium]